MTDFLLYLTLTFLLLVAARLVIALSRKKSHQRTYRTKKWWKVGVVESYEIVNTEKFGQKLEAL